MQFQAGGKEACGMRWGLVLGWGLLTVVALWPGLADAPLTGTEGHRAMTGSQMLERGEYVVPTLFGQTYLRKPPGQYWLIAGAEGVVGQPTEWVWRLPGVLSIAGLVALLAWWGGRWFGTMGALAAGAAAVSLFSWWTMARSADIDAANTLAVGLCVVGLMEAGVSGKRWPWGAMALVVIGGTAMWLLKGPAGLPAVLGAWVGVAIASAWGSGQTVKRSLLVMVRPKLWLSIVLGLAGFGVWATLVWMRMNAGGDGAVDTTGMKEVSGYMGGSGLARYGRAVGAALLSPTYALPACLLAIPVILGLRRGAWDERERRLLIGLMAAFVVGALVSLVVGLRQPRYYYTLLVMVPMFAAAVAGRWDTMVGGEKGREAVRAGMSIFAIVLAVGSVVLAKTSTEAHEMSWPWITAGLAITANAWALVKLIRHRAGWGLVGLSFALLATMSTFGGRWLSDKHDKGVLTASAQLRETVADAPAVYATKTVFDHPEMYHHSGVRPTQLPADWYTPSNSLQPGAWCVLQDFEWELIRDREDIDRWQPQEIVLDGDTMCLVRVAEPKAAAIGRAPS